MKIVSIFTNTNDNTTWWDNFEIYHVPMWYLIVSQISWKDYVNTIIKDIGVLKWYGEVSSPYIIFHTEEDYIAFVLRWS